MKINLILLAGLFLSVACNNADTETTSTDSISTTDIATDSTASGATTENSAYFDNFDESATYVSLQTKKPIKVKKDVTRRSIVDYETNEPLNYFFYNPATRDTFDYSGNVVNSYLIRGNDGTYTLDEGRWKTRVDEDGDVKAKDGDETKIKVDASDNSVKIKDDTSKEKLDGDKYKSKTPTSKTKIKDGKTKVKDN